MASVMRLMRAYNLLKLSCVRRILKIKMFTLLNSIKSSKSTLPHTRPSYSPHYYTQVQATTHKRPHTNPGAHNSSSSALAGLCLLL